MSSGTRKQERVSNDLDVVWAVDARGASGRGKLVDVSAGGVCLQIDQPLALEPGLAVSLMCSKLPALPTRGRIQWSRKAGVATVVCGIQFASAGPTWLQWIAQQIAPASAARR